MNEANNQEMNKTSVFAKLKASFSGRKFKSGAYTSILTVIVLVLLAVINLIISKMDLKVDLSANQYYTLTQPTKDLVKGIKDDITIYYMVETGKETQVFKRIAEKYDSLSKHIDVVLKDPVLYPKFASQYVEDEVRNNSFLVVNKSNNRAMYIDYEDLLVYGDEFNYETFSYNLTGIDVEGKLTSAIQYVTTEDIPTIYTTTGHKEKETGEIFTAALEKLNVKVKSTPTLTISSIPEDCDTLFINSPETDFTADEIDLIMSYMEKGGNVVLVADYKTSMLPNLKTLVEYYGIQMEDGIVCEGDSNRHVQNNPHLIIPEVLEHGITGTARRYGRYVVMPSSTGLRILDQTRSSLTVEPLLVTSNKAYAKINLETQTLSKEDGDPDGPFYVGLIATDTFKGNSSSLVVYSSEFVFDDSALQSFGNYEILTGTVSELAGGIQPISVRTRSLALDRLRLTQKQANRWGIITVVVIPLLILAGGVAINLKRRKR
jgi:ABC-2 type transport system permease protein